MLIKQKVLFKCVSLLFVLLRKVIIKCYSSSWKWFEIQNNWNAEFSTAKYGGRKFEYETLEYLVKNRTRQEVLVLYLYSYSSAWNKHCRNYVSFVNIPIYRFYNNTALVINMCPIIPLLQRYKKIHKIYFQRRIFSQERIHFSTSFADDFYITSF